MNAVTQNYYNFLKPKNCSLLGVLAKIFFIVFPVILLITYIMDRCKHPRVAQYERLVQKHASASDSAAQLRLERAQERLKRVQKTLK